MNPHRIGPALVVAGVLALAVAFTANVLSDTSSPQFESIRAEATTTATPDTGQTVTPTPRASVTATVRKTPSVTPTPRSTRTTGQGSNADDADNTVFSGASESTLATAGTMTPTLPPATATAVPPTAIAVPPTSTPEPLPPTPVPPTATPLVPTPVPPTLIPPTPIPPTAVPPTPTSAPAPPAAALDGLESQMYAAHNQQRGANGLPGLQIDGTLVAAAQARAQDMASKGYFSHTSPTGETAFVILDSYGYSYVLAGENIARNNYPESQSVGVAMDGFMNSPGHRANILETQFTRVGIGVARDGNGMIYFAVVFAG